MGCVFATLLFFIITTPCILLTFGRHKKAPPHPYNKPSNLAKRKSKYLKLNIK